MSAMRRIVMGLVLLLIPFALLEAGLRVMGIGGSIIYVEDPACGYRPKPSQHFSTMGFPITILENGHRGPPATSGVIFVGDSVTYGTAYVRDEETFPALLGGANAGVNGWGPPNIERFLATTQLAEYTQVVWTLPSCDVLRPFTTLRAGLISTNRRMWLRMEYLFRFLWYGLIVAQPDILDPAQFDVNVECISRAAASLNQRGIGLLIVHLPYEKEVRGERALETPYVEKLKSRLVDQNIPYVTATPTGDLKTIYRDTVHMTAAGNRWLAEEIRKALTGPGRQPDQAASP